MEGTILPPGVRDLPIFIQHSREPWTVVDNFGDVDPQEGLPAEPLDKAKNSRGRAAGAGHGGGDVRILTIRARLTRRMRRRGSS